MNYFLTIHPSCFCIIVTKKDIFYIFIHDLGSARIISCHKLSFLIQKVVTKTLVNVSFESDIQLSKVFPVLSFYFSEERANSYDILKKLKCNILIRKYGIILETPVGYSKTKMSTFTCNFICNNGGIQIFLIN